MNGMNPFRRAVFSLLAVLLSLFTLAEVNYPLLTPQSQLAIFALLGLILVFLKHPLHSRWQDAALARAGDWLLVLLAAACFGYVLVQSEPLFSRFWIGGQPLGNRAGMEQGSDYLAGLIERQELFLLEKGGRILATGECRVSESQPPFADLGMIVYPEYRGQGLGTEVLLRLRREAATRALKPICSTEAGNIAARTAILRAGFRACHRLLEIGF